MSFDILMPQLGSGEEATLLVWHSSEGDSVIEGYPLFEIETDKANVEIKSPATGILGEILVASGETVVCRTRLATICLKNEAGAETTSDTGKSNQNQVDQSSALLSARRISPRARRFAEENSIDIDRIAVIGTGPEGRIIEKDLALYFKSLEGAVSNKKNSPIEPAPRNTPLALKMADELGVDLNDLVLGLPGSRIRSEDVLRAVSELSLLTPKQRREQRPGWARSPSTPELTVTPLTGIRKRIAENVTKSVQTIPHVTLVLEADMTECLAFKRQIQTEFESRYKVRLTLTDILVKAVALSLEAHPLLNSSLIDAEIRVHRQINVGVAVALSEGLLAPVLKDANFKSLQLISDDLKALVERAKAGASTLKDLSEGTFTITNLGGFGIDFFNPIIVPGQAAILGVGQVAEKAVVVQKQIVIRSMMNLCLSFDHRILDGAPAAQFLQSLKELLETPYKLLL